MTHLFFATILLALRGHFVQSKLQALEFKATTPAFLDNTCRLQLEKSLEVFLNNYQQRKVVERKSEACNYCNYFSLTGKVLSRRLNGATVVVLPIFLTPCVRIVQYF